MQLFRLAFIFCLALSVTISAENSVAAPNYRIRIFNLLTKEEKTYRPGRDKFELPIQTNNALKCFSQPTDVIYVRGGVSISCFDQKSNGLGFSTAGYCESDNGEKTLGTVAILTLHLPVPGKSENVISSYHLSILCI